MLSSNLLSIEYYLDDRTELNASDIEKLIIRIEQCREDAKQLERANCPNVVTLQPEELTDNVVPLLVARRRVPTCDDGGAI